MRSADATGTNGTGRSGERPLVLVVDDEPSFVDALAVGLEREGFGVEVAEDGLAADLRERAGDWEAAGLPSVRPVGDALVPGTIAAAVWDGRRYAEQLGEPLDADGVPFLREIAGLSPATSD